MYIESINIKSFGRLSELEIKLSRDVNILEGKNESGKSTVAEFIKFMLYGMGGKAIGDAVLSERKKYIGWNSSFAGGMMTVVCNGKRVRIDRAISVSEDASGTASYKEALKMTDLETGDQIFKGKNPGDVLLGVPEDVFSGTAFVRQLSGVRVDGGKLSSSAENLLFTADEAVNTEKAAEKLDAVRRQLRHKNGRGGSLYEKEKLRDELTVKLDRAKRTAGELISLETAISELSENRDTAEKKRVISREKYDNFEAVVNLHKFDKLHALEGELSALYTEKEKLLTGSLVGAHFPDERYVKDLKAVSDGMAVTSASIASVSRQLEETREERGSEEKIERCRELSEGEDAVITIKETAENKRKTKKSRFTAGILSFITAIILLAVSVLTFARIIAIPIEALIAVTAVGAVCAVTALVMFILSIMASAELKRYLRSYGADSIDTLSARLDELLIECETDKMLASKINALEAELYVKYNTYDDAMTVAKRLLALRGVTAQNEEIAEKLRDVLAESSEICKKERELSSMIEEKRTEANGLERSLSDVSEADVREKTASLDTAEYDAMSPAKLKLERDFNENAVIRLTEAIHESELRKTQLLSTREDPAEAAVRLDSIVSEIARDDERYRAAVLAMETLSAAGEGVRAGIVPRIRELAAGYMSKITGGKYSSLGVDGELSITVDTEGALRELEYMSEGTSDAAYLSLRLALIKLLYRNTMPPLIFDEAFARLDDGRTEAVMNMLCDSTSDGGEGELPQAILFTCQKREGVLAERMSSLSGNGEISHIKL